MNTIRQFLALTLVVLVVLGLTLPVLGQDDEIVLGSFEDNAFSLQGLIPAGWSEAAPGVYARGSGMGDLTSLIIQAAPGMTAADLTGVLLGQLGITALPEPVGEVATDHYTFTVYAIEVSLSGLELALDLALAEDESGVTLVLLQTLADDYPALHEAVFLPAVNALAPLAEDDSAEATPETAKPYTEEAVTFTNPTADDVTLAGTLTLPEGDGPFPAVILISGSGQQDRDESMAPVAAIKPFALLADHLGQNGIAVLRYDDRGFGQSTGDFFTANTADFATDASAAVDYLLTRDEIDPAAIGLLGHSEGGMVAPITVTDRRAAGQDDIAFIIALAGPGVSGKDTLIEQNVSILSTAGKTAEEIAEQVAFVTELADLAIAEEIDAALELLYARTVEQIEALPEEQRAAISDPEVYAQAQVDLARPMYENWFPFFFAFEPAELWPQIEIPVLALFGGLDLQVSAEQNAPALEAALQEGGNPDATVIVIPTANHLFQEAETGAIEEYATLEQTFHPDLLPTITDWLLARFGLEA
ncbi:alpha/beta hydrolase family protein [Chloroflexota bacterium]